MSETCKFVVLSPVQHQSDERQHLGGEYLRLHMDRLQTTESRHLPILTGVRWWATAVCQRFGSWRITSRRWMVEMGENHIPDIFPLTLGKQQLISSSVTIYDDSVMVCHEDIVWKFQLLWLTHHNLSLGEVSVTLLLIIRALGSWRCTSRISWG